MDDWHGQIFYCALRGISGDNQWSSFDWEEFSRTVEYDDYFNVDKYYDTVKDFTFPTYFIPCTPHQAECMIRTYEVSEQM